MRRSFGLLMLAAAACVTGCQASEDAVKGELRAQTMSRCLATIAPKAAGVPGFNGERFCACVTGRAMGNRSVSELKGMFEDKAGFAAEGRQAARDCLAQQLPGNRDAIPPAPSAAPAPGGNDAQAKGSGETR